MNNYDRIYEEISKETGALAPANDLDPTLLLDLILDIVDLEDQNQIKQVNINQQIQGKILLFAQNKLRGEDKNVKV